MKINTKHKTKTAAAKLDESIERKQIHIIIMIRQNGIVCLIICVFKKRFKNWLPAASRILEAFRIYFTITMLWELQCTTIRWNDQIGYNDCMRFGFFFCVTYIFQLHSVMHASHGTDLEYFFFCAKCNVTFTDSFTLCLEKSRCSFVFFPVRSRNLNWVIYAEVQK